MTRQQRHMFDDFERSRPLRQAAPSKGFRWCDPCNGTGRLHDPTRICRGCQGLGQVLL